MSAVEIPDEENLQLKIIEVNEIVEGLKTNLPKLELDFKTATKNVELAGQILSDFKKYEDTTLNLGKHLEGESFILAEKNNLQQFERAEKLRAPYFIV